MTTVVSYGESNSNKELTEGMEISGGGYMEYTLPKWDHTLLTRHT